MKSIRQRFKLIVILTFVCVTISVLLSVYPSLAKSIPNHFLLAGSMTLSLLMGALGIREYSKLKNARLIMENQILSIYPAIIDVEGSGENTEISTDRPLEVIVSCFGILLGSEIIKFNQDSISLQAVEIRNDTIALTYGTENQTRKVWLLHQVFDSVKLAEIVEAFRYETGIITKIKYE